MGPASEAAFDAIPKLDDRSLIADEATTELTLDRDPGTRVDAIWDSDRDRPGRVPFRLRGDAAEDPGAAAVVLPSSRPSSRKNVIVASMSATTMPTLSIR